MTRILEKLRLTEVSSVDRGAGEGVRVMLMKRDDVPLASESTSLQRDFAEAGQATAKAISDILADHTPGIAKSDAIGALLDQHEDRVSGIAMDFALAHAEAADLAKRQGDHRRARTKPAQPADPAEQRKPKSEDETMDAAQIEKALAAGEPIPGISAHEIAVIRKSVGHEMIMEKARELRKASPNLTIEQAYTKAFTDPANAAAAAAAVTKAMPGAAGAGVPFLTSQQAGDRYLREGTQTAAPIHDPHAKLIDLANQRRQRQPNLTIEQAYAKELMDPANRDVASAALARPGGVQIVA